MSQSSRRFFFRASLTAGVLAIALAAGTVQAQARTFRFELPSQSLSQSLRDYGQAAGLQIIFTDDLVGGLQARPLVGELTAEQAIERLLDGTGLMAERTPSGALMIRRHAVNDAGSDTPKGEGGGVAQGANENAPILEEVIVTANKREERLHDVSLSVTAVTGESLQRRQELNIADISAQVPGLSVQRTSPSYNRLILRGQNTGGSGATVSVVVDDVPFTVSGSTANGAVNVADINPYDIDRVEVLRGPQGTLYGAGAEGGILKYVTKQADPTGFDGAAEVGIQSMEHGDTGMSDRAWVNLPLGEQAAVRASGYYEDIPGYIDNWVRGEKDSNSGYRYGGRLSLMVKLSDDITVNASTFVQKLRTKGNFGVNVIGPGDADHDRWSRPNGLNYGSFLDPLQDTSMSYSYVNVDWDLGWSRLTSVTSYGVMKFLLHSDASGAVLAPGVSYADYLGALVYGVPMAIQTENYNGLKKYNQELRLASPEDFEFAGMPVEWQGGLFFTREVSTFRQGFVPIDLADERTVLVPPLGGANLPSTYNELSGFGEATLHFTPRFDVSLGGRVTKVKQHAQVFIGAGLLTAPIDLDLGKTRSEQSSTTFSFAPRYHFDEDTMAYLRVASGFRPGGPQLLVPDAPVDFPASYGSDSTMNYEIGFRTYLLDKRISIDLAAYYVSWQDIQIPSIFVSPTTGLSYEITGNAGSAETKGIEWNFAFRPFKGLALNWLGSYGSAELTKDAMALNAVKGDDLPNVPGLTSTVNVDYEWPVLDGWRAYVGGTWSYTGKQWTGFGFVEDAHVELPAYDLFSLRAGLTNNRWSVDAYVRNLTDEQAFTGYSPTGAVGFLGSVNLIQPRTVGVRVGVKY